MPLLLQSGSPEEIVSDALVQPESGWRDAFSACFLPPENPWPPLSSPLENAPHPVFSGRKIPIDPAFQASPYGRAVWELAPEETHCIRIHTFPADPAAGRYDLSALCAAYRECIRLASLVGCATLALPLLPLEAAPEKALECAVGQIGQALQTLEDDLLVILAVPEDPPTSPFFTRLTQYIAENRVTDAVYAPRRMFMLGDEMMQVQEEASFTRLMQHLAGPRPETFQQMLFRLIDEKGLKDPEVYKRANLDRRLFSRIRSRADYQPSKNTALALVIALKLDLATAQQLLEKAGYTLSKALQRDLVVEFFIREQNYDIFRLNEALFRFSLPLLGAPESAEQKE